MATAFDSSLIVSGRLQNASGPELPSYAPEDGQTMGCFREASAEEVEQAVESAQKAFTSWSQTTPFERSEYLNRLADRLEQIFEELALIESKEAGKPYQRFIEDEKHHLIDPLRYYASICRAPAGLCAGEYVADHTSFVRRDPLGVAALITPWNYPLMMAVWKLAPALAAGNTVVLKPSEVTSLATISMIAAAQDVLPPGVLNLVCGRGHTVGKALAQHRAVRIISVTGSIPTGQAVLMDSVSNLKRVHLELGGKAPVIIYPDADLEKAVETLKSASFYNAGQDCTAACKLIAHHKIYEELCFRMTEAAQTIKTGPLLAPETELGPLISKEHQQRVHGYVQQAQELTNIKTLCGGELPERSGYHYPATVLAGAQPGDEIVEREVFGPVVSLSSFDDESQLLEWVNSSDYGLAASVWTRDIARGLRMSKQLQYGCVWVNQHLLWPTEMPHGGLKLSGVGKEMSPYGLEDYSVLRHIMVNIGE